MGQNLLLLLRFKLVDKAVQPESGFFHLENDSHTEIYDYADNSPARQAQYGRNLGRTCMEKVFDNEQNSAHNQEA